MSRAPALASTLRETDFIRDLFRRTGCGFLLDVNNVLVSATNQGHSALAYLADFPLEQVGAGRIALDHWIGDGRVRDDPSTRDGRDCDPNSGDQPVRRSLSSIAIWAGA